MEEKRILDKWNNRCVGVDGGFNVAYYNDYIGELDVYVLDRSGKHRTYHMHYHEVYPKTVTAVELNHGTTNATLRVTAEIQYAFWTTSDIHLGSSKGLLDLDTKRNPSGIDIGVKTPDAT